MADIHISFDLETLSTRPDAHLLSIGAAARVNGERKTFHAYVHELQADRHVEAATVDWWSRQDADLRNKLGYECAHAKPLIQVLRQLTLWYAGLTSDDNDRLYVWGNGSGFDIAILEHAYKSSSQQPPWAYHTARDLRTLKHLAETLGPLPVVKREGTHHDARDDAIHQLNCIEAYWAAITEAAHVDPATV